MPASAPAALQVSPTSLPEVLELRPRVFGDRRGFFLESYNAATFADVGIPGPFVQDNHSGSTVGVLRGLHYQLPTRTQGSWFAWRSERCSMSPSTYAVVRLPSDDGPGCD
jgi:dTDP-4-dehydrorhamnose 3,5-epimerase-like enzyme